MDIGETKTGKIGKMWTGKGGPRWTGYVYLTFSGQKTIQEASAAFTWYSRLFYLFY